MPNPHFGRLRHLPLPLTTPVFRKVAEALTSKSINARLGLASN